MRSRALSLHQTAVFAGAGLGAVATGYIADALSWHAPFLIFGGIGLIHGVFLWSMLKDAPIKHTAAEVGKPAEPIGIVLGIPPAVMLCVIFALGTARGDRRDVLGAIFRQATARPDPRQFGLGWGGDDQRRGLPVGPARRPARRHPGETQPDRALHHFGDRARPGRPLLLPLLGAKTATQIGMVLVATSVAKGLFDGCIYAAMQDVVPPHARATAVGMMTMIGFFGAGITPLLVSGIADAAGMGAGIAAMAALYFVGVIILLAMRASCRRAVLANAQPV